MKALSCCAVANTSLGEPQVVGSGGRRAHGSENLVAQSCRTLRNPTDLSLPGSSVHGIGVKKTQMGLSVLSPLKLLECGVSDYVECRFFL